MAENIYVLGKDLPFDPTTTILRANPFVKIVDYESLFSNFSVIDSNATVLLSFPYSLWDKLVEFDDSLYGVGHYGKKIKQLSDSLVKQVNLRFPDAHFVNPPDSIYIERDKQRAKDLAASMGVAVVPDIEKNKDAIYKELSQGNEVYVKVRFGSMGKGITYLGPKKWSTNFNYSNGKISNHEDDHSWVQKEVTGDENFLDQLLAEDVVVEKGIKNPQINGLRFDLRVLAVYGEANPFWAFGRTTKDSKITNVSQGAKALTFNQMKKYVPVASLEKSLEMAKQIVLPLGFNYAGIDILFQGDNFDPLFLELNSFPGLDPLDTMGSGEKDLMRSLYQKMRTA